MYGASLLKLPGERKTLGPLITVLISTEIVKCGGGLSFITSAFRRLGQKDCFKFEFISWLGYKARPVTIKQVK